MFRIKKTLETTSLQYKAKLICKCVKTCKYLDKDKNVKIIEPLALTNFTSSPAINFESNSAWLINETYVCSDQESNHNEEIKLYRSVITDECDSADEECASKLSQKSYFCVLKDNLLNSKPSEREKMIQDFNNSVDSTNLVYWLKKLNSLFFGNFLQDVNARWTSSNV